MTMTLEELTAAVTDLTKAVIDLDRRVQELENPGGTKGVPVDPLPATDPAEPPAEKITLEEWMTELWTMKNDEVFQLDNPDHYFRMVNMGGAVGMILEYHHPKIKEGYEQLGLYAQFPELARAYPMLGDYMKETFGSKWTQEWLNGWYKTHRERYGYTYPTGCPSAIGCGQGKINGLIS